MDIAKYVLTAVVVMSLVSDLGDVRWLIYVFGFADNGGMLRRRLDFSPG